MPGTRSGRYAVGLTLAFFLFTGLAALAVASGQRGGETLFSNMWISGPALTGVACALAALVASSIAVIRHGESAWTVNVAGVISFVVMVYVLAEIVFPH